MKGNFISEMIESMAILGYCILYDANSKVLRYFKTQSLEC